MHGEDERQFSEDQSDEGREGKEDVVVRVSGPAPFNIADRLAETAALTPRSRAVVVPHGRDRGGRRAYAQRTFAQVESEADAVARGLARMGVGAEDRLALFVPPGIEFLSLTFGLFRSGATVVLIDPGMGKEHLLACLEEVDPTGFVGVAKSQAARLRYRGRFRRAKKNVCVGRRLPGMGLSYERLLQRGAAAGGPARSHRDDRAAVIFTSGSTGPPKGVEYSHGMFDAQWQLIRDQYGIKPGGVDLPAFPLFALFNVAMGVTTVVPEMDFTKPALVDAEMVVELMSDQGVTQSFGSPAFWNRVGRHCDERGVSLPGLRLAMSAGAPVPVHVLERMSRAMTHPDAGFHTPYGATESLPACTISGAEVLGETAERTATGAGTCVGRPFGGVEVRVIERPTRSVQSLCEVSETPAGEIGEVIVRGPSVTRSYFKRPDTTAASKLTDADGSVWHRIGDLAYFDAPVEQGGRLWFCGRVAHVVEAAHGPMSPVRCEAVFNQHPLVFRTALVGVGERRQQRPVLVVEFEESERLRPPAQFRSLLSEVLDLAPTNPLTETITAAVRCEALPVDTRHNVKINREQLAGWAEERRDEWVERERKG